jgi:HAD superfamily hydrolase (TIGR01509 family)
MERDRMYSAVIFDLDGLIVDTETIARAAWKRAAADFGFLLEDDVYQTLIGLTTPDIEVVLGRVFGDGFPAKQAISRAYQYFNEHMDRHGIAVKPGVAELLVLLDTVTFPRALATSSSKEFATRKLIASKLVGKFATIICGDEVKNGKPAPDIFLAAAKLLQVAPEHCLVLEDSDNGVRAAHKAGMTTIIIPDLKQPAKDVVRLAHKVFPSLHQAIPFLQTVIKQRGK